MLVTYALMRALDAEYQELCQRSMSNAPRGGTVPVGGGEWMDSFFRAEAIRGLLAALRYHKPLSLALLDGKAVAEISISIWNTKREWQVHRSDCWIEDFLLGALQRAKRRANREAKRERKRWWRQGWVRRA